MVICVVGIYCDKDNENCRVSKWGVFTTISWEGFTEGVTFKLMDRT